MKKKMVKKKATKQPAKKPMRKSLECRHESAPEGFDLEAAQKAETIAACEFLVADILKDPLNAAIFERLESLSTEWQPRGTGLSSLDERAIALIRMGGIAEERFDVIVTNEKQSETLIATVFCTGANPPEQCTAKIAGYFPASWFCDGRLIGSAQFEWKINEGSVRLSATGSQSLTVFQDPETFLIESKSFFGMLRGEGVFSTGVLHKSIARFDVESIRVKEPDYSPYIESPEMISLMKLNGIKSVNDKTIQRKKKEWKAESQPGTNNQKFRFRLDRLKILKINLPSGWDK